MNRYLTKIAAIVERTHKEEHSSKDIDRPHARRALGKIQDQEGLILHHSTGSGKTRTFLQAAHRALEQNPGKRALIVAPASLTSNIHKEVQKHKIPLDMSRVDAMSYEKAVNESENLHKNKYAIAVGDEAHKFRNVDTKRTQILRKVFEKSDKRVLPTATMNYNHPSDIAPLVNIAAGKKILPEDKKEFENRYLKKVKKSPGFLKKMMGAADIEEVHLKNPEELKAKIKPYIDHYDLEDDPEAKKHFPSMSEKTIHVPMSKEQHRIYKYTEGKLPVHLRWKVRMGLPMDKKDKASLNAFSTGVRQASNSTRPFEKTHSGISPKLKAAVDSLHESHKKDKNFRGFVYSNYLGAGIHDYSEELTKRGIKHNLYHGGLSKAEKDRVVKDYNEGRVNVILASSSGSEGLDLKGTKKVQVLEPHFNKSKIKQVIGRGRRFKSHEHLPEKERHVEVEHYISTLPDGLFGKNKAHSIDQYLHGMSDDKEAINKQIKDLLK